MARPGEDREVQDSIGRSLARRPEPRAVNVSITDDTEETHAVGHGAVTALSWGTIPGMHCDLLTIRVWHGDRLESEHPFTNVLGVYYPKEA